MSGTGGKRHALRLDLVLNLGGLPGFRIAVLPDPGQNPSADVIGQGIDGHVAVPVFGRAALQAVDDRRGEHSITELIVVVRVVAGRRGGDDGVAIDAGQDAEERGG